MISKHTSTYTTRESTQLRIGQGKSGDKEGTELIEVILFQGNRPIGGLCGNGRSCWGWERQSNLKPMIGCKYMTIAGCWE